MLDQKAGIFHLILSQKIYLHCFDAVDWVAGSASSLQKTEWWDAGVGMG